MSGYQRRHGEWRWQCVGIGNAERAVAAALVRLKSMEEDRIAARIDDAIDRGDVLAAEMYAKALDDRAASLRWNQKEGRRVEQ